MRKILRKLLTLITIINFIGIILEGAATIDNSQITNVTESVKKDKLETIKEKGKITVTTPLKDITYFYLDPKTHKISGIDADIVTEIVNRLGINKIEIKVSPFSELIEELKNDDSIDIAAGGIYITPRREEIVSFTQPLYKGSEAIVVPTFSKINFMSDLKNAVIGVEKGTVFVTQAERWKKDNLIKDIEIYETPSDLLNAINNYKIDAGIVDSVIVKHFLLEDKNLLLRILKDYTPEVTGNVGIAIEKNDTALLNAFNQKINEMKADGTLYAILVENGLDKENMIN
ncbi:ABC transporter substrate-binding protein [Clostridium chromiireducens]|uniref:ABC transporter substrate-binding protein n=1 Tax=Clostridium chromiireducens TaxID=225345 RepID=UPI003AF6ABED